MKVCVLGLWHLGNVTAACLAGVGHRVIGLDFDVDVIAGLADGRAPLFEPGLDALIAKGIAADRLRFTTDAVDALRGAAVVWVAYDTPVNDSDEADVGFVTDRIARLFPFLEDGAVVLVSSQLPVGSTRGVAERFASVANGRTCHFAYSPENLRLGKAIEVFSKPDRIVVGVDEAAARAALTPLLESISPNVLWTGVESAEMIKHAINAFLATSIVFANEVAAVCELVGADAQEVARGLKSESRIGPGAYVSAGGPFAGGTLARDIVFLSGIGKTRGTQLPVLNAVKPSNDWHKSWTRRSLLSFLPEIAGRTIAILGLTYKPGTDTLRRSSAVELAEWLIAEGAKVKAYDPRLTSLPDALSAIDLKTSIEGALDGAAAVVVSIDAPEFKTIDWTDAIQHMDGKAILIDPTGAARARAADVKGLRYATVGLTRGVVHGRPA